jgi:sodium/pantothenate symporter
VLNDTMQGMVMLIGTIVLLVGIVHAAGGLSMRLKRWKRSIRNWSRRRARMISFRHLYDLILGVGLLWVIGLPHTAVRCISIKTAKPFTRASSSARLWSRPDVWYASGGRIRARGNP